MPSFKSPAIGTPVVMSSDLSNSTLTLLNTPLAFQALPNSTYHVEVIARYSAAASTTGARFVLTGTDITSINGITANNDSTTSVRTFAFNAIETPSVATAGGTVSANTCKIEALVYTTEDPSTVVVSFASEVDTSQITLRAGSYLRYTKLL
jgi:hypothetical protein